MAISATQKFRLGVFVIIGMLILAAFIVIPIGQKMSHKTKTYYASFEGESLQGLDQGANVKFNGVKIGRVERVFYDPENITTMKIEMSIDERFPMRVDMYATTGLVGITGLKYVEISGGTNEAEMLKPGGSVATRKTLFGEIGERAGELTDKVDALLSNLAVLTSPDSLRPFLTALEKTLSNVADMVGEAKGAVGDGRAMIPRVGVMADTIQMALNEVLKITQDIKDVTSNIRNVIAEGEFQLIMSRADSTVVSVKTLTDNLSLMIMQTREDFSISMENLRETMESANILMRTLSENPSMLLRGEGGKRDRDTR